jgi:hypothetical protein
MAGGRGGASSATQMRVLSSGQPNVRFDETIDIRASIQNAAIDPDVGAAPTLSPLAIQFAN